MQNRETELLDLLARLCAQPAPSGREAQLFLLLQEELSALGASISSDALGNLCARFESGAQGAKTLLLDAHMDEIGLMVTALESGGFVRVCSVGGISPRVLPGALVRIHAEGGDVPAIIASKPPHLQKEEEQKKLQEVKDCLLDTGLEDAAALVRVGDFVTFEGPLQRMGDCVCAKALDDRAGLAVLILALRELKESLNSLPVNLVFLASSQEEVGLRGAHVAAFALRPDAALIVDVGHGKTPDTSDEVRCFPLGEGPMVGFGPNLCRSLSERLCSLARQGGIPHQREAMGGHTGTNAWAIQTAGGGAPCALLSLPLRYMHSTTETANIADLLHASALIAAFVRDYATEGGQA